MLLVVSAAVQRGRVREGEGRGMDDVLAWLFNEGSSSMVGADGDAMSITSLQVRFLIRVSAKGLSKGSSYCFAYPP
jgi:hypothetical protein